MMFPLVQVRLLSQALSVGDTFLLYALSNLKFLKLKKNSKKM